MRYNPCYSRRHKRRIKENVKTYAKVMDASDDDNVNFNRINDTFETNLSHYPINLANKILTKTKK